MAGQVKAGRLRLIGKEILRKFARQATRRAVAGGYVIFTGAALFGLTGLLGRWFPTFDIVAQMAPVFVVAGIFALALALCGRSRERKGRFAAAAIATLGCGLIVAPEAGSSLAAPSGLTLRKPGAPLRVVEINLWRLNADPRGTAAALRDMRPDVLLISEPTLNAWALYKTLRSQYPFHSDCFRQPGCEIGILSRLSLDSAGVWWPAADNPTGRRAGAAYARVVAPDGGAATVVATRVTWPFPPSGQMRQSAELAAFLHRFDPASTIVGGDFNTAPWSQEMRRQDAALRPLQRRTRALFTYPARFSWEVGPWLGAAIPFPLAPIDHVYAGPDWRTVEVSRGPRTGSDHYPVLVVLRREQPRPAATPVPSSSGASSAAASRPS